ncbi:MAG: hypothetical protein KDB66_12770 [Solirubrobacterales bacterium]|nr:hypothetical protein [Solirubrobacterales bacterium]
MSRLRLLVPAILVAIVTVLIPAAGARASQPLISTGPSATEAALAGFRLGPTESGASASRRRLSRYMPKYKAKNNARYTAYQVYLDPRFNFDHYGVGNCHRASRSMVYCYTWASEDYYDDMGYYDDTMLCDWLTVSSYNWRGRMKIKLEQTECVWLSET